MPSGFFSSIFGGKLALTSGLSLAAVATSAIPVSLATWGTGEHDITNVTNSINEGVQAAHSHLSSSSQNLSQEYTGRGNDAVEAATNQTLEKVTTTWHDGGETAKPIYGYLKENAEDINYYSFVFGNLIKSSLSSLPVTIRDTIVYDDQTKSDQQLLSVQKMMAVGQMKNFKEFASKMIQLAQKHHVTFRTMTSEDGRGLINILREIREADFDQFMQRISNNIDKMKADKHYENATQLLQDAFVGSDELNTLPRQLQQLCQQVEKMKERLQKEVKGLDEEKVNKLQKILKELSEAASKKQSAPKPK